MKLKIAPVLVPIVVAAISAATVRVSTWDTIKTGLITALSVAAAAALVRLSRGLPFTTASHFETEEIEKITRAVIQLARSLRSFLAVTVLTMGLLLLTAPALELARPWAGSLPVQWGGRCFSALIGAVLAYVVVRLFQIVSSDLSLLGEQSRFMVRAVQREDAKKRLAEIPTEMGSSFKTPENYGHRIQ
ncbi:hypothetical protein [Tardiphaga robiniae]|uniref:Uncharacterized protein n=1 Tax=Tardiphaga robiniae TaxID=943830 RepID=A0A163XTZ9_9BRAD|nr:hypothetical protein [Tardiphaga robiniae]KZD21363.1 hypothetical protein A4A58_13340 [Tardiphaga robiniae]